MEDLNLNGLVDIGDLNILLKNWDDSLENILNNIESNWGNKIQKNIFVSPSGNNNNSGSFISPVRTLEKAIELANNDDIIYLRGVADDNLHYFEKTTINESVTIKKYGDENPVIDGTKNVRELTDATGWTKLENQTIIDDNNIQQSVTLYKITLRVNTKVWQCFHNREEVMGARYPSAQWRDNSVYEINSSERPTRWCWGSTAPYENGEIIDYPHDNDNINLRSFVDAQPSGFNLDGALIHLNVGSFRSYTKRVNSMDTQTDGVIKLTYDPTVTWKKKHHHFYLENKLEFLNSQNEWFYDKSTQELYIRLFDDEEPTLDNIRLKTQSYALDISTNNVTLENLNFFGTTFKANNADNLLVTNCNFLYPSCYAHMVNEINAGTEIDPTSHEQEFTTMTKITSSNDCKIYQCSFKYTDGTAIEIDRSTKENPNTIEDCYFNYIDKKCTNLSSVMVSIRMEGIGSIFKNNTIHKTGASATVNVGNEAEISYNDIYNTGYLQSDGAMIHCMRAQQKDVKIHHNWVHDSIKYGIRFDGNGNSEGGFIHHNVGWNCEGGIMVKGGLVFEDQTQGISENWGGHYIFNNTIFNSVKKNDILVLNVQSDNDGNIREINHGTLVMNNLSMRLSGHRSDLQQFEDRILHQGNYSRDGLEEITDINDILTNIENNIFSIENTITSTDTGTIDNTLKPQYMKNNLTSTIGAVHNNNFSAGITWSSGNTKNSTVELNRLSFVEQSRERILEGEMVYNNFEGGFWGFISNYGEKYLLVNQNEIPENIKYNKLKVKITVELSQYDISIYMWGNYMVNFTGLLEIIEKPKILCLHGGGGTGTGFRGQQGMQDLMTVLPNYEFVFINSPEWGLWLRDPPEGKDEPTTDPNWANTSIQYIDNYIDQNGPFYGLLGYSQGAAMVIVYSAYSENKFDCLMMFNGYLPTTHQGLIDTIDRNKPFLTPALNFIATNDDWFYGLGQDITPDENANDYNGPYFSNIKEVVSTAAEHALPINSDATFTDVTYFIRTTDTN